MTSEIQANNYLPSLSSLGIKISQICIEPSNIYQSSTLSRADFTSISRLTTNKNNSQPFFNSSNKLDPKINNVKNNNLNDTSLSFDSIRKGEVMKKGDKGKSVEELQMKLTILGFPVQATGNFGNTTELKVKQFQKVHGISQTGKLGPTTIKALDNAQKTEIKIGIGKPTVLGINIANAAKREASRRSTVGWCYAGVATALDRVKNLSATLYGRSAYMAAPILAKSSEFKEVKVKSKDLPNLTAGSIVVWGKTSLSPHGHISVALGNGKEASDHVSKQLTALRGHTNARVFVPIA